MKPFAVRWLLLTAMPLLVGASPLTPRPEPLPLPAATNSLPGLETPGQADDLLVQPFDLDATQRMAVPVMVGGEGPFSFLVDTGAERTVIARELAERLKLGSGRRLRLATIGLDTTLAPSFRIASLQMTGLSLDAFDAPAFAGRHLGAAGLIGVDMLETRRLLIDFRNERMEILPTRRLGPTAIRDSDAIIVSARNKAGRLILSDARIDGQRIDVVIDTGAQSSVGNLALQRLVTRRRQNEIPFFPAAMNAVTGELVPATRTSIKRIWVEGIRVNSLPVYFADSRAFAALGLDQRPTLLLGMDCLSLFDRVEIDFPNRRVVLDLPSGVQRENRQRYAYATPLPRR